MACVFSGTHDIWRFGTGELYPTPIRTTAHGISAGFAKCGALWATVWFNYLPSAKRFWATATFNIAGAIITVIFLPDPIHVSLTELDRRYRSVALPISCSEPNSPLPGILERAAHQAYMHLQGARSIQLILFSADLLLSAIFPLVLGFRFSPDCPMNWLACTWSCHPSANGQCLEKILVGYADFEHFS